MLEGKLKKMKHIPVNAQVHGDKGNSRWLPIFGVAG